MLPGFRFLFAAIVMCMSVLVFGLGAAALLRTAHEDFASNPSWRTPPEPRFAQQDEATKTVLAVLSVQPPATEPAIASPPPEPETTAALTPSEASPREGTKPATSATEAPSRAETQADAPGEAKTAATGQTNAAPSERASPSASEPAASTPQPSPTPQQMTAPAPPNSDQAETRIATLGGPAVITEEIAAARASDAKSDRSLINKRLRAEHARERRRRAARLARLAQQAAAAQLLAENPFAPHLLIAPTPAPAH
jgi:hypothetical protein